MAAHKLFYTLASTIFAAKGGIEVVIDTPIRTISRIILQSPLYDEAGIKLQPDFLFFMPNASR